MTRSRQKSDALTPEQLHRVAEIEKLARSVKEKMAIGSRDSRIDRPAASNCPSIHWLWAYPLSVICRAAADSSGMADTWHEHRQLGKLLQSGEAVSGRGSSGETGTQRPDGSRLSSAIS